MPSEHGPFRTEAEALATQAAASIRAAQRHPYGRDGEQWRAGIRAAGLKVLTDACEAAGVILGDYELGYFEWLTVWETAQAVALAGIIHRAHEAGLRAAQLPVTQWGLRLLAVGGSGEPIFDAYPGEDAARLMQPTFQGPFDAVVVSRQLGPWTEATAPETEEGGEDG